MDAEHAVHLGASFVEPAHDVAVQRPGTTGEEAFIDRQDAKFASHCGIIAAWADRMVSMR
jgi:hypothetical protein